MGPAAPLPLGFRPSAGRTPLFRLTTCAPSPRRLRAGAIAHAHEGLVIEALVCARLARPLMRLVELVRRGGGGHRSPKWA